MSKKFSVIAAVDSRWGIGKDGKLPWQLSADLQHFREITTTATTSAKKNVVIMGRKTWDSLPERFRPLPNRINVVVSRNSDLVLPKGVFKANGLEQALSQIIPELGEQVEDIFVIGGAQLYAAALTHPGCQRIYLTRINRSFDCNIFFPSDLSFFKKISESAPLKEKNLQFIFQVYSRA